MKRSFYTLLLSVLFNTLAVAQNVSFTSITKQTQSQIEKADETVERVWRFAKKCADAPTPGDASEYAKQAKQLAEEAILYAKNAEKSADSAEKRLEAAGCFTAASEADDAEDYCRHLGYYTYEMSVYAKKAAAENDLRYIRAYIFKVVGYAEDAYEAVKNAKLELEEALKDWEGCKK